MPSAQVRSPKPRWYLIPVRLLLVTFLVTLLSFAVTLLLGILGVVIGSRLHHIHPNLTLAYRLVAIPAAAVAGSVVLASSIVLEIRHYRQAKALAEIERAG